MRQSWETMTSVSASHIILTPTQPVGSGGPKRGSNPGPPHQESRALPTELPRPVFQRHPPRGISRPMKSCQVTSSQWRQTAPPGIVLQHQPWGDQSRYGPSVKAKEKRTGKVEGLILDPQQATSLNAPPVVELAPPTQLDITTS